LEWANSEGGDDWVGSCAVAVNQCLLCPADQMTDKEDQLVLYFTRHGSREDWADPTWKKRASNPHDPDLSDEGILHSISSKKKIARKDINLNCL
jgi:hypothetical protein